MTVHRQDGDQDQIDPIEQILAAVKGDVAQQHHAGVLAVDLAGMDARLGQQHRLGWIEGGPVARGNDGIDGPAFRRGPERFDADQVGGRVKPIEPGAGLGIVGREIMLRVLFKGGGPGVIGGSQQVAAGPVPLWGGRKERAVPRLGVGGTVLGHGGTRQEQGAERQAGQEGKAHSLLFALTAAMASPGHRLVALKLRHRPQAKLVISLKTLNKGGDSGARESHDGRIFGHSRHCRKYGDGECAGNKQIARLCLPDGGIATRAISAEGAPLQRGTDRNGRHGHHGLRNKCDRIGDG